MLFSLIVEYHNKVGTTTGCELFGMTRAKFGKNE